LTETPRFPLSKSLTVDVDQPNNAASSACDMRRRARSARTSAAITSDNFGTQQVSSKNPKQPKPPTG
jgi:hypothetical protein